MSKTRYELFDFIKVVFTDKEKYKDVSIQDKSRHMFMFNRRMAIRYPLQANFLNRNGLTAWAVMDYWQSVVAKKFVKRGRGGRNYVAVPNFIYTKTKKSKSQKKKKNVEFEPSDELITIFMQKYRIPTKDFENAMLLNPKATLAKLQRLEKQMNMVNDKR